MERLGEAWRGQARQGLWGPNSRYRDSNGAPFLDSGFLGPVPGVWNRLRGPFRSPGRVSVEDLDEARPTTRPPAQRPLAESL